MQPPTPGSAVQAPQRDFHETIDIAGRLSVRYQANSREEALHGSFAWSQTPAQTTVTLLSPLGQTVAVIDVNAEGAALRQAGQPAKSAANVDALTAETLGWPLPVAGLREWLQGFAVDSAGKRVIANPPETRIDSRDGWRIHYASWLEENPSSQNRPKRIDLARHTEQAGDVSLRIVIDTWQPR
ncbi:lipoprotein insertase outer membrane protein LolB [Noviherbaspirillum sp. ST9]|uniref:lipoprotein insertase outer membrane protein LolB n=1 Tax=Noviherbaspirillum sp. ST9 TaxID=3401606 RepID=UPI003B5867CE